MFDVVPQCIDGIGGPRGWWWQDNDSSGRATAQRLVVHPNAPLQRLRQIDKHTGRSFSRPGEEVLLSTLSAALLHSQFEVATQ